ncbi:MAG: peptide-methionine (R)-S-oxide reductase MsrB [Acidiferrobacter sp.]
MTDRDQLKPLTAAARAARIAGLNDEERRVLLHAGTEAPFCGGLLHEHGPGLFACRLCHLPLFASDHKFESGTGWPSFTAPIDARHIRNLRDTSHGMVRTEVRCARCDSHLGHLFPDGPPPRGTRYCLNAVSLAFFPAGQVPPQPELVAD